MFRTGLQPPACTAAARPQRPACTAAAAPSTWRRPGPAGARTRTRTRTRTAAARRPRGSGRRPGAARRRGGRSRPAVRGGGQPGSAFPPQRRRGLPAWAGPLRGCPGSGAGVRAGGAEGAQGAGCAASSRARSPFPGRVCAAARPLANAPFPQRWAWVVPSGAILCAVKSLCYKIHVPEDIEEVRDAGLLNLLLLLPSSGAFTKDRLQPARPSLRYFCFWLQTCVSLIKY